MIKIGIVGTGGIAEWHVTEFQKNNHSTVVAACDAVSYTHLTLPTTPYV